MAVRTVAHRRSDSVKPSRTKKRSPVLADTGEVWGQSVMTLRTGKIAFSFGRERRFHRVNRDVADIVGVLPSGLNPRSTSFGYGQRWTPANPTGKDAPPSTVYDITLTHNGPSGYSFGGRNSTNGQAESPGPGSYDISTPIGTYAPKFSIRKRIAHNLNSSSPPPDSYRPTTSLTYRTRFKEIGFGYGKRTESINRAVVEFPGPGAYFAPSRTLPLKAKKQKRLRLSSPAELLAISP